MHTGEIIPVVDSCYIKIGGFLCELASKSKWSNRWICYSHRENPTRRGIPFQFLHPKNKETWESPLHELCSMDQLYKVASKKYFPQQAVSPHGQWNDVTRSPAGKGSLCSCPHTCWYQKHSMIECAGMLTSHWKFQSRKLIYLPLKHGGWANVVPEPKFPLCWESIETQRVGDGDLVQEAYPSGCLDGWWENFHTRPSPWYCILRMTLAIGAQTWYLHL